MISKGYYTLLAVAALALSSRVHAATMPTGAWPQSTGVVTNAKPIVVAAGTVFDGRLQTFERSDITCNGQKEGSSKDAVFLVEAGATLRNVIIGKNQMEGVHCDNHDCTIENVWWDDVCEDALSVKGGSASSVTRVIGCGARFADDKVIQHNGPGTVIIDGFFAQDFGKLYRSCGTCGNVQRNVQVSNVLAVNPKASVVTVNANFGDRATLSNIRVQSSKANVEICGKTNGGDGGEPTKAGSGPDGKVCIYNPSDVIINGAAAVAAEAAAPTAPNTGTVPVPAPTQQASTGLTGLNNQLANPQDAAAAGGIAAPSINAQPVIPNAGVGPGNVQPDSRFNQPLPAARNNQGGGPRNWWNFRGAGRGLRA